MYEKNIDTEAVAKLARLELSAEERQRLEREMREFADFAACLSRFSGDADLDGALSLDECGAREDEARSSEVRPDELLSLSASESNGYITVPITVGAQESGS